MGYFANSTEGVIYQNRFCSRCRHGCDEEGCMIWSIHITYNYSQFDEGLEEVQKILDALIPREGIENKECTMFTPGEG